MIIGHKMQDTSLDTWDEIINDGSFGEMTLRVRNLIEDNPGKTVKELLKLADGWGNDRNKIAPKVTVLAEHGVIVRPSKRKCTVTGRRVFTHEMAPKSWREHRARLMKGKRPVKLVKNRIETESSKNKNVIHTTIEWTDGSVSCTCNSLYHRPSDILCHHAKGMVLAISGRLPGQPNWKAMYEELEVKYMKLQKDVNDFREMYDK